MEAVGVRKKSNQYSREKSLKDLKQIIRTLKSNNDIDSEDLNKIYESIKTKPKAIPTSIFTPELGALESITKYLHENINYNYRDIAKILKRNSGPIGVTYRRAKKKVPSLLKADSDTTIPLWVIANKRYSLLENIVAHLKKSGLSLSVISRILKRDPRTIWTVWNRYEIKRRKNEK